MSLRIRLSRGGAKKRPYYRIVVADSRMPRDGRFIEKIGSYDPMLPKDDEKRVQFDADRAKHWLGLGAKPSDRVARFLGQAGMIEVPAIPEQTKKNQPRAKAQERMREEEERRKAAEEAPKEAAAEPAAEKAPEEPAAEEPAAEEPAGDAGEEATEETKADA